MDNTRAPFLNTEKNPAATVVAGVAAIAAIYIYFLIFVGFAFVDHARAIVPKEHLQIVLGALGVGGVSGCFLAARCFVPSRAPWHLAGGFTVCLMGALLTLVARSEIALAAVALVVGLGTAWTSVTLSLCLRPTLHGGKLGTWCGVGTGLAYALCNQPFLFEASIDGKIITAAVVAAIGLTASLGMKGAPTRPSALPDYQFQAAAGWIVFLLAMVFLDTLVFFIIQNSLTLKQLSWETPLILQGNAFVHFCAAFVTGLVLDQRWPGISALVALMLLVTSAVVLGLQVEHFPKARILYIAAVSIYSTILIYVPARGGRPRFTATVFAVSGWLASGLALSTAMAVDAKRVPPFVIVLVALIALAALFARLLSLKRSQEVESERLIQRKPA